MTPGTRAPLLVRPLIVRSGARFACFSDGLCCSDIHGLGPLTRTEIRDVQKLVPKSVAWHDPTESMCMKTGADGMCAQREGGLCGIHKHFGAQAKPAGCRRFPYGLLATPDGGRVTTEHRCPCRTLGERPPLDLTDAIPALSAGNGRLWADHRAPMRVPMSAGRFVSFAKYQETEKPLIERLLAGEKPEDVIDAKPLPDLAVGTWPTLIAEFYDMKNDTAGGIAMAWFADALLHMQEGHPPPERTRPWAPSFENAIRRTKTPLDPEAMLRDWIADELWMMRWVDWDCTFDSALGELSTRLAAVRILTRWLEARGLRPDQATAEALMINELGACNEHWTQIVGSIANDPAPLLRNGEPRLYPKSERKTAKKKPAGKKTKRTAEKVHALPDAAQRRAEARK